MKLVRDRDYWSCMHCPAFVFPTLTHDGVRLLGGETEHDCPVCGTGLSPASMEGRRLLSCGNCHGVLVGQSLFAGIVQTLRSKHQGEREAPRPITEEELDRKVSCPICRHRMEAHPYYGPGNVVLDSCGRCGVIWCDKGEIATLGRS
jgi:Zn-finger nucleic acid-binding protein